MLVGAVDGGIHRYLPIDQPLRIGTTEQDREHCVPGAIAAIAAVMLPYRLPRPEMCRQVPPRDAGTVPVDDPLAHEAVVLERAAQLPRGFRHQRGNLLPLGIGQHGITRIHTSNCANSPAKSLGDTPYVAWTTKAP